MRNIEGITQAVRYHAAFDMSPAAVDILDRLRTDRGSFGDKQLYLSTSRTIEARHYERYRPKANEVIKRFKRLGEYIIKLNGRTDFKTLPRFDMTRLFFGVGEEDQPYFNEVVAILNSLPSLEGETRPPYHLYCDVATASLTSGAGLEQEVRTQFAGQASIGKLFVRRPALYEKHIQNYPIPRSN